MEQPEEPVCLIGAGIEVLRDHDERRADSYRLTAKCPSSAPGYFPPLAFLSTRRCKNIASLGKSFAPGQSLDFFDHCGRSILYGSMRRY